MTSSGLTAQPLQSEGAFNWIYLTDWIVNGILCLFFLFYFNRLFATLLLYLARLYVWRVLHIYVDLQSLQISPLAGRIFFKGARYHGDNETIFVRSGYITWRYWLRTVKQCDIFEQEAQKINSTTDNPELPEKQDSRSSQPDSNETPGTVQAETSSRTSSLPCRISLNIYGVEAFLYNRSPAYDWILHTVHQAENNEKTHTAHSQAQARHTAEKESFTDPLRDQVHPSSSSAASSPENTSPSHSAVKQNGNSKGLDRPTTASSSQYDNHGQSHASTSLEPPSFLRLLPIHVECQKGAAVLGNENTKAILTVKFDNAGGEFNAAQSGPLDIFKILMNFSVEHPYIQLKPNVDYKRSQLAEASAIKTEGDDPDLPTKSATAKQTFWSNLFQRSNWNKLTSISIWPGNSAASIATHAFGNKKHEKLPFLAADAPDNGRWLGLTRYLNDDQNDEHDEWKAVEYAKSSVLADITKIDFGFYWDIPGPVPSRPSGAPTEDPSQVDEINGSTSPEYGMTLVVHGGHVNYGPWADRHRLILQQLFFPYSYADAVPTEKLKPGESRVCNIFKLNLRVEEDLVLRIPFREPSKDAKWKGRASTVNGQTARKPGAEKEKTKSRKYSRSRKRRKPAQSTAVRPFAWFDLKVSSGTTINYIMDMFPTKIGYNAQLIATFQGVDIFSSLNHGLLWRCPQISMDCDLSHPLTWNGLRHWIFNISIDRLDFFLLRDHTFLLIDMIEDWTAGQIQEFFTFSPYRYQLKVHFQDYKLYLNTNDANIIDNADDLDQNEFVILYGKTLDADLIIPIDRLQPPETAISFNVSSTNLGFELCMPPKSTLKDLVTETDVAQLETVEVVGAYTYCSEVKAGLTETLYLDITGKHLNIAFFGWLGRHFAKIKENYFGDMIHFRTLDEFQGLVRQNFQDADSEHPPIKSNDLDVLLDIRAEDVNIMLPCGLYDADENVKIKVDSADCDLRVNNYYLELMVNSSPLELNCTARPPTFHEKMTLETTDTQLFIDGVKVFGHRLFGLPPSEPPYMSNWDVEAGSIVGECIVPFVEKAIEAAKSFALGLVDAENAVPLPHYLSLNDSTFVRFACPEIRIWCRVEQAACMLFTQNVSGSFHDLAGKYFSQQLHMVVPNFTVACVDTKTFDRHRNQKNRVAHTQAYLETTIYFSMVQRNLEFKKQRQLQHDHIQTSDCKRGNRVPFLAESNGREFNTAQDNTNRGSEAISLDLPSLPAPLKGPVPGVNHLATQKSEHMSDRFEGFSNHLAALGSRKSHTVSFPSPFKAPFFPLIDVEADLTNVPVIPTTPKRRQSSVKWNDNPLSPDAADDYDSTTDEDTLHTCFMINTDPGVVLYCTPEAVRSVCTIIEQVQPTYPNQLLDDYHFTTINEVLSSYARRHGKNAFTDISIKLPHLHVRLHNHYSSTEAEVTSTTFDRYNVVAQELNVSVRLKSVPARNHEADASSVHITLQSLLVNAQEGSEGSLQQDAALQLTVQDILVWLIDSDSTTVHTSFYTIEVTTASKKVEYLASLIHRTTMLVDEFRARFEEIIEIQNERLKYLVFKLIDLGSETPDPMFLTRPSYVIRSSPEHIRNSDSWKMISRFHYYYLQLPESERNQLTADCISNYQTLPPNAESTVLAKLDSWLSWDAAHVKESFAVRIIYGSMADIEKLHDRSKIPVGVSIRSASLKLIVDPGQEQTEFGVDQIALGLSITPAASQSVAQIFKDYHTSRTTVVQVKIGKYSFRVNWNVSALVDHILNLFEREAPRDSDVVLRRKETQASSKLEQEEFHIVFTADSGILHLETINASISLSSLSPTVSVTGSGWSSTSTNSTLNVLVATHKTFLQLNGLGRALVETEINKPSLVIDVRDEVQSKDPKQILSIVGDSKDITFAVKDEILGVMEIIDRILREEATYVRDLVEKHGKDPLFTSDALKEVPGDSHTIQISLILFLDNYSMDFALFNDLVYSLTGRNIRLSISPSPQPHPTYNIDYDLKAHSHRLLCPGLGAAFPTLSIDMPPVNGTMMLQVLSESVFASGLLTMEKVLLDGASIYGVLHALSPSKIQSAVDAIQADGKALKENIEDIFPASAPRLSKTSTSPKAITFSAGLAFAGIAVSADAPATAREKRPSNILFDIKNVHLRASNVSKKQKLRLNFPEMQASIQEISLELRHMEEVNALRSCGKLSLSSHFSCHVHPQPGKETRKFNLSVTGPTLEINAETAPLFVEVMSYLQDRAGALDLSRERKYLKRLRNIEKRYPPTGKSPVASSPDVSEETSSNEPALEVHNSFSFELDSIQMKYIVDKSLFVPLSRVPEDLVFTLNNIRLLARNQDDAQLRIDRLQLALVPHNWPAGPRPLNSALMPEIVFAVSHKSSSEDRKLTFKAAGKTLDIQLDPGFVIPASDLERSITLTSKHASLAAKNLRLAPSSSGFDKQKILGNKQISSFVTDLDFAGAVVRLQSLSKNDDRRPTAAKVRPQQGTYGKFSPERSRNAAILRAPGIFLKVRYNEDTQTDPALNIEMKIDASSNVLQPSVVPLIMEISDSVKKVIQDRDSNAVQSQDTGKSSTQSFLVDESIVQTDPRSILGRTKLNVGIRICQQAFSLTCQPIAKVDASAKLEDIYITINDVHSEETGHFFAASATFKGLETSLKHVYSREPTFGFNIESVVLSIMNNRHISGTSGVSAILNINPASTQINAKQLQDILLFREIWLPPGIRTTSLQKKQALASEPQEYFVRRYQQVAAATAFPWNATVAIEELKVDVDLGQSIGKTSVKIAKLWAHSKKTTKSRQNLCVGVGQVSMSSSGRMSGFVDLEKVKVRTSIAWPYEHETNHIPLIQGSIGFEHLKAKAAFDYQAFAVAEISSFEFIMYNVRDPEQRSGDRLVAILDGEQVNAYCISASAALGLSLAQAFERLVQEKKVSYEQALRDIEKFLRRRSSIYPGQLDSKSQSAASDVDLVKSEHTTLSLHTDVVVTLRSVEVGAFPSTLLDRQILKLEASDIQARFAVVLEHGKIHSGLGLTLGQLRVGLSSIPRSEMPKTLGEIMIEEVIKNATSAKGGVILRVPRVVAAMQTWQAQDSNVIDYIFKSSFEGKIDVGWNYSRISFIRGMWRTHTRTLAARLDKPLPESAVKITGGPKILPEKLPTSLEAMEEQAGDDAESQARTEEQQQKITAEINLPQSKYTYRAREPPIIETPQLRDMGEATPPLEWVGLHRDKLPNLTHQIIIVTLLEIAKEVEDAYSQILGSA